MTGSRRRALSCLAAGAYSAWAVFIYVFADHAWWPMFLYPIIWPLSYIFERVLKYPLLNWVNPDPNHPPDAGFLLFDRISGALYILGGAIWIWFLCFILLGLWNRSGRNRQVV